MTGSFVIICMAPDLLSQKQERANYPLQNKRRARRCSLWSITSLPAHTNARVFVSFSRSRSHRPGSGDSHLLIYG